MIKNIAFVILAAAIVIGGYLFLNGKSARPEPAFDPLNAAYTIEGQSVKLTGGKASTEAAPGSAAKVTTQVFGEPILGDLNNDGRADAAVMLAQDTGGSGTFYYVAAALGTAAGTMGTNALLLGDRIAPQTLEIKGGQMIANYAERRPNEPMTTSPSIGVSKYFVVQNGVLTAAQQVTQ